MNNEKPGNIRYDWLSQAGVPSRYGIALNITISDTQYKSTEYQVRGIVAVPSRPENDEERWALAKILLAHAEIPDRPKRRFRLLDWERTGGSKGIEVQKCGKLSVITAKDIIPGSFRTYEAPDYEAPRTQDLPGDTEHVRWRDEYQANQYCRFESRKNLHQRWQDIRVNTQVLSPSGNLTLTKDNRWYRLSQHVLDEMLMRGQPHSEENEHPRVRSAMPFMDKRLCSKAAEVVAALGSEHDVLVKYGQLDHMKELYEEGDVWINPASDFEKLTHNQAVRDDERSFVCRGGIHPMEMTDNSVASRHFYAKDEAPDDHSRLIQQGAVQFVRMFDAPELERDQQLELRVRIGTDYWTYCLSEVLDPRLLSDFEANACVILRKGPFMDRLVRMMQFVKPSANLQLGRVTYEDPLGALTINRPAYVSPDRLPMTKLFRYAYQREFRFVWFPVVRQEKLTPIKLHLGSLANCAEFLECKV